MHDPRRHSWQRPEMLDFREDTARGRAVFASRAISAGEHLITEAPLLAMQLPEAQDAVRACFHCCRPTGTASAQLAHVLSSMRPIELPLDEEDDKLSEEIPCRHGCGVLFCSSSCEEAASEAHALLCKKRRGRRASDAVCEFESHALSTFEPFLFGARVVCEILARIAKSRHACAVCRDAAACSACVLHGVERFAQLCRAPWWDISDEGVAKGARSRREAREAAAESRRLLLAALGTEVANTLAQWLTLEEWGGLLGAARRNALCIELAHPLADLCPALCEWLDGNPAEGPLARRLSTALEALPQPLPQPLWTALYDQISRVNHSCRPCAEVHWLSGEHYEATLIAKRLICAGDEITISVRGQPLA